MYRDQEILIAVSVSLFGFFGFALYPICLELSVECAFPVAEGTTAGFLLISGYVLDSASSFYITNPHECSASTGRALVGISGVLDMEIVLNCFIQKLTYNGILDKDDM